MKPLLLSFILLVAYSTTASAQFEIKSNPIALLFEAFPISMEYSNLNDWGTQIDILAFEEGGWGYLTGKYYLSPKYGADRFHVGAFAGGFFQEKDANLGIGFMVGYKAVSKSRIVFEVGGGIGRNLTAGATDNAGDGIEAIPYLNLNIGYRFVARADKKR